MNKKQKIIVSVVGITIVLLALLGLTYAYFLTRIQGNTNEKSISVTTANLEIKYEDNNDIITGDRIEPGTTLPSKTFTVTNNGNNSADYSVALVNIINTFNNTEDVVYNLTCTSYDKSGFTLNNDGTVSGTEKGSCSGVEETEFPNLNSYIVTNSIDVDFVHVYIMTVTYKETGIDQSIDMNKELSAKIDIFDPKSLTIQGNVTNSSENDYVLIHSKEQESSIVNGSYKFIGITPDTHTITVKNRKTADIKSATLVVEKGTPSVSDSKIIYDDNKNVLEEIRNKPNSVLLLDEVDKAHPSVINLFYQILEEGKIKDSKGKIIRFNNVIIIMTSNVGFEKSSIGFNKISNSNILSSLKNVFSTAFINRIDNVIIFDRLEDCSIRNIISRKLDNIKNKYNDIIININDSVINEIVDKCEYYEFGARRIDKIISKDIENVIIDGVINGSSEVYINSICSKKNITMM